MSRSKDAVQANPMKRKLRSSTAREEQQQLQDTRQQQDEAVSTTDAEAAVPEAEFEDTIVVSPRTKPGATAVQPVAPTKPTPRAKKATKTEDDSTLNERVNSTTSAPQPSQLGGRPSSIPPSRWTELSHKAKRHARETARKTGVDIVVEAKS